MAEKHSKITDTIRPANASQARTTPTAGTSNRQITISAGKLFAVIALLAVVSSVYFFSQYRQAKQEISRLSAPQEAVLAEQHQLVEQVGRIVELPTGEAPTVATVSDVEKLKHQKFFEQAENGDKVLIYTKAEQAVLYRPSSQKVVQIAPVNLGETQSNLAQ